MDLTKAPSESSKLQVSYDLQQSIFGDLHAEMDAQLSSSTPGSGTSDRSKYAFFALQRAIERLRSFYYVLLVAFGCLISGVFLLVLTEILWLATRLTTGPCCGGGYLWLQRVRLAIGICDSCHCFYVPRR